MTDDQRLILVIAAFLSIINSMVLLNQFFQ